MSKIIIIILTLSLACFTYGNNNFQILHEGDNEISNINTDLLSISNRIYNISIQQIQIGKNIKSDNIYNSTINPEILQTLGKLKYYVEIDIIMLLDMSKNKNETLSSYLLEANNLIEKSDYFIYNLEVEIQDNVSQFEECSKQKSTADKNYFQSLEQEDLVSMKTALNQSKDANECASKNRIDANAKNALLSKITLLRNTLEQKYNFLSENQSTIIKNFEIIKDNIAEELYQITKILNQYQIE